MGFNQPLRLGDIFPIKEKDPRGNPSNKFLLGQTMQRVDKGVLLVFIFYDQDS